MFAYIKGTLETKSTDFVVIDVSGIGYKIFMPSSTIEKLGEIGQIAKVHTYYYVREDNISLYGFYSNDELRMFELLISVSGIGAKSANAMLSEMAPSTFALAIISNDVDKLKKVPGIGAKTAARIVLELKDKLKTEEGIKNEESISTCVQENEVLEEAIGALKVLGYVTKEIETVLSKIDKTGLSVEDIIRKALAQLGR